MKIILPILIAAAIFSAGCSTTPRITVLEATVIGLDATPGDASTQPPQVTLAFKRTEVALIPVSPKHTAGASTDCYSTITGLGFDTTFFGETKILDFIGTGFAAQSLAINDAFSTNFWNTSTNLQGK